MQKSQFIGNYESDTVEPKNNIRYAKTEIGKICFLNNINEIPILDVEKMMQNKVNILKDKNLIINNASDLMNIINDVFFSHIPANSQKERHKNILRLRNESAQKFYTMFLNWRIKGASYSEMIQSFLKYWNSIEPNGNDEFVFVGRWGDITRGGHQKLWTDITNKNIDDKINLAIVRIKEEQDFLDNVIIKYIEVLYDLGFLEESFYLKIKYGTNDKRVITLVKNGISLSLANLIIDKYLTYVEIDDMNSTVFIKEEIINAMHSNDENHVLVNELSYFVT